MQANSNNLKNKTNQVTHDDSLTKNNDMFTVNSMIILGILVLIFMTFLLPVTPFGASVPGFLQNVSLPGLTLLVVFSSSVISLLIGKKSEEFRTIFGLNAVFIALLLSIFMYSGAVTGEGIVFNIPSVLGFGANFRVDPLTFIVVMACSLLWMVATMYSHKYMIHEGGNLNRFHFWWLFSYGGILGALMSDDLLTLFLFFEVMYICCYFLVAQSEEPESLKAAARYLYMGIIGSLCVLLGISIIYSFTGTFNIPELGPAFTAAWETNRGFLTTAVIFILSGLAIKSAVFPMHFWLPDAHANSPSSASAILSGIVIKVYVFSAIKVIYQVVGTTIAVDMGLKSVIAPLAILGMIMGSVFALGQKDIKKMLAYSSVAQVGYLVLGIGALSNLGLTATMFHITTHALMKSALFLCAGAIIFQTGRREIKDFAGLGYKMPITMAVFSIGALSMVGIPGFNGFMSKWNLAMASVENGQTIYVFMIMVSSFLNAMYYLPIVISAFLKKGEHYDRKWERDKLPLTMIVPLVLLGFGCILLGLFPQIVMNVIAKGIHLYN